MSNPNPNLKLLSQHKVYVVGGNHAIERMFEVPGARIVPSIAEATIVCFTGGADVSPELYGEERHPTTHPNAQRDKWETACFKTATKGRKLIVGICRGGQFLNVMNGGSLWQDVDKHAIAGEHMCTYEHQDETISLSRSVRVTSTHHQMMIPALRDTRAKVWAWAGISTKKTAGMKNNLGQWIHVTPLAGHSSDCEIVFYPQTKSLCFQPHPEYNSSSTRELFFTCIERALAA